MFWDIFQWYTENPETQALIKNSRQKKSRQLKYRRENQFIENLKLRNIYYKDLIVSYL